MAKTLNQIAHEYAVNNPNVSVELAFLEGMLYQSKAIRKATESIDERRQKFEQELSLYIPKYGQPMLREFYDYWTELNKSGTKMRFENERTWELSKRLTRWAKNNKNYGNRNRFDRQEDRSGESLFDLANALYTKYQ